MNQYTAWYENLAIANCYKCPALCKSRTRMVISRRTSLTKTDVLFIGEAPGEQEDKRGIPFVGQSGKWLDKFIDIIGVKDYAITNVVKCRPANNRKPTQEEVNKCKPYLFEQISLLKPKLLVLLGTVARDAILSDLSGGPITEDSEIFYSSSFGDVLVLCHPAYYLRKGITPESIYEPVKNYWKTEYGWRKDE